MDGKAWVGAPARIRTLDQGIMTSTTSSLVTLLLTTSAGSVEQMLKEMKQFYSGEVVAGHDLDVF
jgi:hypothetical protein